MSSKNAYCTPCYNGKHVDCNGWYNGKPCPCIEAEHPNQKAREKPVPGRIVPKPTGALPVEEAKALLNDMHPLDEEQLKDEIMGTSASMSGVGYEVEQLVNLLFRRVQVWKLHVSSVPAEGGDKLVVETLLSWLDTMPEPEAIAKALTVAGATDVKA